MPSTLLPYIPSSLCFLDPFFSDYYFCVYFDKKLSDQLNKLGKAYNKLKWANLITKQQLLSLYHNHVKTWIETEK
jgi:hypothetical protein